MLEVVHVVVLEAGPDPYATLSEYKSKIGRHPKVDWYPNLQHVSSIKG